MQAENLLPPLPWIGSRIKLDQFREVDITPTYIAWLNNPTTMRFSNQRFWVHSEESCRKYLSSFWGTTNQFLRVDDVVTGTTLGTLTIYHSSQHKTVDIGLLVGHMSNWGKGIGSDAFGTAVNVLSLCGSVRKVTAGTVAANKGMIRIMEKAGLSWEATKHAQELIDGQPMDVVFYARFCT